MLAQVMPRQPAPMLACGAMWLRLGVRPTAFGNALGNGIVDSMVGNERIAALDESSRREAGARRDAKAASEARAYEAQRSQEWIGQSDAIQQRVMGEAAAPYREQQWIEQSDAIQRQRMAQASADVAQENFRMLERQYRQATDTGAKPRVPNVRPGSPGFAFSDNRDAKDIRLSHSYQARVSRILADQAVPIPVGGGSPGQYMSPSTGDGLSPIQRYLRDSLRGMDPARANRVETQLAFGVQDAAVAEAGGLVVGAGLKLAGRGVMATRGAVLSEQSLARAELSAELKALLRADLPIPAPLEGLAPAKLGWARTGGSGPVAGTIGITDTTSVAALKNYYPRGGGVEFVFDPTTNTFVAGRPVRLLESGSPHEQLAQSIGAADKSTTVGGTLQRGKNGEFLTTENSGHYGKNWNNETRAHFEKWLNERVGLPVIHQTWRR